jgi:hypothetical protein
MRILNDDHYRRWPQFASRICYAYNSAAHESLGGASPHQIFFGVSTRTAFDTEVHTRALEDELPPTDLENTADFLCQSVARYRD